MKVLLINPTNTFFKISYRIALDIPLQLLYIAAVLKEGGHEVQILDSMLEGKLRKKSDDITQLGLNDVELFERIKKIKPDIVGISCRYTTQIDNVLKTAKIAKKVDKNIITVIGGNHPTVAYADILKNKFVDYCIVSEGEYSFRKFVDCQKKDKIENLAWKKNGKIILNEIKMIDNLDDLPLPAYDLIDMERYFQKIKSGMVSRALNSSERQISFITSRGCPFKCVFCSIHLHMGRKWRYHSVGYIKKHLDVLMNKYKIKEIHFEDDNLTLDKKRAKEIFIYLLDKNIVWDTPNGVRADTLDRELLILMKKSGCKKLFVAAESGVQEVINKIIHKNLDLNKIEEISKICKEIKLPLRCYFVIGLPGETKENIRDTLKFALKLYRFYDVIPSIAVATPLPGTELYDICYKNDYIIKDLSPENFSKSMNTFGGSGMIKTNQFDPELLKKYYFKFFLKPFKIEKIKKDLKNLNFTPFKKTIKNKIRLL